ncbi:hypothetical protein GCM10020254_26830 [Streptomyces goshikiensis]
MFFGRTCVFVRRLGPGGGGTACSVREWSQRVLVRGGHRSGRADVLWTWPGTRPWAAPGNYIERRRARHGQGAGGFMDSDGTYDGRTTREGRVPRPSAPPEHPRNPATPRRNPRP